MMKRSNFLKSILALTLTLALSLALALPALGAEPGFLNFQTKVSTYTDGMFPDVPKTWYTT